LQTRPEHFVQGLEAGSASTNTFLRRLHNFALALAWLPWPLLGKPQWPTVRYRDKRALTRTEHQAILAADSDPERRAFYALAWQVGAAQGDLAARRAENVDWAHRIISFSRRKTGTLTVLRLGEDVVAMRPAAGPLFPRWSQLSASERACRFARRGRRLKIVGVSLHSYRYAWAERAKMAGYPERFAQEALGHKSKAVHRAYARKARVELPPLEEYEKLRAEQKVIRLPVQSSAPVTAKGTVT
jgi:integrase